MFENAPPKPATDTSRFAGRDGVARVQIGRAVVSDTHERGGNALRMLDWTELTARLNAARDLRVLLRRDASGNIGGNSGSFADAAARYFRTREHDEHDVNPIALEHRKGSSGMVFSHGEMPEGVVSEEEKQPSAMREKIDD